MNSEIPINNTLGGVGDVETPAMAPSPAPTPTPVTAPAPEEKKSKGALIGMVALGLLAAAGIGFGIYEFMDSSKKSVEIKDLKTKVVTLEQNNTADESEGDYIYISEWGIKITKPSKDELKEFSYAVSSNTLYLWGAKPAEGAQATTEFGIIAGSDGKIINNTYLGRVTKSPEYVLSYCEAQSTCGIAIKEFDDGSALMWHDPDTALEVYADQQDYDGQLQESISILKTHFSNPDNYYEL